MIAVKFLYISVSSPQHSLLLVIPHTLPFDNTVFYVYLHLKVAGMVAR